MNISFFLPAANEYHIYMYACVPEQECLIVVIRVFFAFVIPSGTIREHCVL